MFDDACAQLEAALAGRARADIVSAAAFKSSMRDALVKLRRGFESHAFDLGGQKIRLTSDIRELDAKTRAEGFNAMNDWNGPAVSISAATIPVDMLNFVIAQRGTETADAKVLAILLDFYFLYVLALLSLRVWDDGDANANLDRLNGLLKDVQGENGSGQLFASNAETLMIIATSHYEPEEHGYRLLLERVMTLDRSHQLNVALGHAQTMGCHLRFGFEATYNRNLTYMRDDNGADYPWMRYGLAVLIREYDLMHDAETTSAGLKPRGYDRLTAVGGGLQPSANRELVIEAILQGLTPDVSAFAGNPEFAGLFQKHRDALVSAFERHRPSDDAYSPISLFFNFCQNVLKGMVADALLWSEPWALTMNDLFTGLPAGDATNPLKEKLSRALMTYAKQSPDLIRGKWMPAIVYDPQAARRAFAATMRHIKS